MAIQAKNRFNLLRVVILSMFVAACAAPPTNRNVNMSSSATAEAPTLEFHDGDEQITLTFTDEEMKVINRELETGNLMVAEEYIMQRMAQAGKKCCEPRKRLDQCTWRCCNAAIVKTCNAKLGAALGNFGN